MGMNGDNRAKRSHPQNTLKELNSSQIVKKKKTLGAYISSLKEMKQKWLPVLMVYFF